jgi:hypothetical protein
VAHPFASLPGDVVCRPRWGIFHIVMLGCVLGPESLPRLTRLPVDGAKAESKEKAPRC